MAPKFPVCQREKTDTAKRVSVSGHEELKHRGSQLATVSQSMDIMSVPYVSPVLLLIISQMLMIMCCHQKPILLMMFVIQESASEDLIIASSFY